MWIGLFCHINRSLLTLTHTWGMRMRKCQKRPIIWQKRPIAHTKETYQYWHAWGMRMLTGLFCHINRSLLTLAHTYLRSSSISSNSICSARGPPCPGPPPTGPNCTLAGALDWSWRRRATSCRETAPSGEWMQKHSSASHKAACLCCLTERLSGSLLLPTHKYTHTYTHTHTYIHTYTHTHMYGI